MDWKFFRMALVTCVLLLGLAGSLDAMKGRHFVCAFLENYSQSGYNFLHFVVTSTVDTTVTIQSTGFSVSVTEAVTADTEYRYEAPAWNYYEGALDINDMSYYITSEDDITLYCYNFMVARGDGYMAIPVPYLSTTYVLVSMDIHDQNANTNLLYTGEPMAAFLIVATEDATTVTVDAKITGTYASVGCAGGTFHNGDTRPFTLNKYQIVGAYCGADITGTRITSDKPVAVWTGHNYQRLLASGADHAQAMMLPVDSLGRNYVIYPLSDSNTGATYRIVSTHTTTNVRLSNGVTDAIDDGDPFDVDVDSTTGPLYLEADHPVLVLQFAKNRGGMTLVPPTSLYASSYHLANLAVHNNKHFFLTVIVPTDHAAGLQPRSLFPQFEVITGTCFAMAVVDLPAGFHSITHDTETPFGASVNQIAQFNGQISFTAGYGLTEGVGDRNICPSSRQCNDGTIFPCDCTTGYFTYTCNDTSQACAANPCFYTGACTNQPTTTYTCACTAGNGGSHCETDVEDNCVGNGCVNGECVDERGSYSCDCIQGYLGTMCETEINECTTTTTPCDQGTCVDGVGNYTCTCNPGYEGWRCDSDIDECASTPCQNNGACTDAVNSFTCNCGTGFSGTVCEIDMDECISNPCINGTCNDLAGMYNCTCTPGFEGVNCETDIDECAGNSCQNGGNCNNLINDFSCTCLSGYSGDLCEIDVDECTSNPCQNGGGCNNHINMYNCTCPDGYSGYDCETDIDECVSGGAGPPCVHGACVDAVANYTCTCDPGYEGWRCDSDINECDSSPCQNNGVCTDAVNSFTCACANGFSGTVCDQDTDECLSNPCINGTCNNLAGMYNCTCTPGFEGVNCETEIDECLSNPCQNNGTCTDAINDVTCDCMAGYNGTLCENDIDECASSPCHPAAVCVDGVDSYTCTCAAGYTGDNCDVDIDECASNPCVHGSCSHAVDVYTCTCDPGYNDTNCDSNIDECLSNPCQNNGTCNDLVNEYSCDCVDGFNGTFCENDIDECSSNPCQNGACVDGVNSYVCNCNAGYNGDNCELDIDECGSSPCINGTCVDDINMYSCNCTPGFVGVHCETDFDECTSNPCMNGACIEMINMYNCSCDPGYTGVNCEIDIDECASDPCFNDGNCTDLVNGFNCTCPEGINGTQCEIGGDPCLASPCQFNGTCVVTDTGYNCTCPEGTLGDDCETNIDDCSSSPCMNNGTCVDGLNAFECLCPGNASGILCELMLACGCPCLDVNITDSELAAKVALIKALLTVDKTQLSATKRKKISVPDDRPSSQSIGFSGIALLVGAFGFFFFMDGINILQFFSKSKPPAKKSVFAWQRKESEA